MLLLVGDDWAEDHHDVELQDETGRRLGKARLPEGIAGIARLHAMIGEHVGDDDDEPVRVVVGIKSWVLWLGWRMSQFTAATAAPDPIQYLDTAARTAVGLDYKRRLVDALGVQRGHVVVDIGCGPGTDLARLADAVAEAGTVIGIDQDPGMVAEARRRLADRPNVEVRAGDAHALPLQDASVDRARVDRVLQHLEDPARALAEAHRVLRGGGVFGMAEPDWDTLAVADEDVETSRCFARFVAGRVRNATIGRQLVRLAALAGFEIRLVEATAATFRDFDTADQILGLRRNAARAVQAGALEDEVVQRWLDRLADGPFLAGFTFYLVIAQA